MKAMCGACWIESSRDLTTGQPERRQRYACYSGGGGWEASPMSCNKIGGRPAKRGGKIMKAVTWCGQKHRRRWRWRCRRRPDNIQLLHFIYSYSTTNAATIHSVVANVIFVFFICSFVRFSFCFVWMCNIQQSYFCVLLVVHDRDCRRPATLQR